MEPPTTTVNADDQLPQIPGAAPKLRLMCSYGGHIIPTPNEKSLRYIGGETRMVAVDRRSSLSSIISRLSSSLLHGRCNFSLKYQLPNEELDSLVSLSSDEDLENLIDEYDRLVATSSSSNSFRLRIFIFFARPETAASMGALLDDAKSETWFVDALNGVSLLPRGLSDSAAVVDQLLDLDNVSAENNEKQTLAMDAHEVFAGMSDSYVVENNSSPSFGSSSSSPSMSNLPPIRVRVEESVSVGTDEQVEQTVGSKGVLHNVGNPAEVNQFQVAEDERSDRNKVQIGLRKPPLPISSPSQLQHKNGLPYNLPSRDSVGSNTSTTSECSDSRLLFSQDPVKTTVKKNRAPASPTDLRKEVHESNPPYQMLQLHERTYLMPSQPDHDVYSQQQQQQQIQQQQIQQHLHQQQQQQQMHRLEVQQQHFFNGSMQPEFEICSDQIPISDQSDQHQNSESQNQRMNHLQETLYISSPQSTEHQQSLHHQRQQFIHPSMQQSCETPAVQGQISEQLRQHFQQQQNQFVPVSVQKQVYHPPSNQAEQLQEQKVQQLHSQQQFIHGSKQYVHQVSASQVPMPSYYSMYTTQTPHQQVHHQTMYMLPVAQAQPYINSLAQSNISDMSVTRLPTQPNASMLPAPAIQTQTETTPSTLPMSQNPTIIQVPSSGQNHQQYVSYSQFIHPSQSMAVPVAHGYGYTSTDPQVYYSDPQHPSAVPQYQTMNSFTHGRAAVPSEAAPHLPPADQHP